MSNKYDIFISYRRTGGAQYARILQLMLSQRGFKVFLDYDELKDGVFGKRIKAAIQEAPIFMLVLSKDSLDRCKNEDDWVREEILYALQGGKKIIPVNPDKNFDGMHTRIPENIASIANDIQHSEIDFGQTLGVCVDFMISNRISSVLGDRMQKDKVDVTGDAARETLAKIDAHNKFMKRLGICIGVIVVLLVGFTCYICWQRQLANEQVADEKKQLEELRTELEKKHKDFNLVLSPHLSALQMNTIDTILMNMVCVREDTLWMNKFEFTEDEWKGLFGTTNSQDGHSVITYKHLPMVNVSFGEVSMILLDSLRNMTGINFQIPSVADWQYAAHGGKHHESFIYVGDNDVEKVAWYKNNSGRKVHPSDGQQGKEPNMLDLYDMSGNVGEMCNTPFGTFKDGKIQWTLCGGDFNSDANDVLANSKKGFDTDEKSPTIGFRLAIRKEE